MVMKGAFVVAVCLLLSKAWAENDAGDNFQNDLKEISRICDESYCPAYTVKEKAYDYELREYPSDFIASTKIMNVDPKDAYDVLSLRLKGYTLGDNDSRERVQTGLPKYMVYYRKEDGTLARNFIENWLISQEFSKQAPSPLNPLVKLIMWPSKCYYTAYYTGGFLTMDEVFGHVYTLAEALKRDNTTFDTSEFTIASYENSEELYKRHLEIHFHTKCRH